MMNEFKNFTLVTFLLLGMLMGSCGDDNSEEKVGEELADDGVKVEVKKESEGVVWAEEVQSEIPTLQPFGWQDEYWDRINKGVNYQEIYDGLVAKVIKGEIIAYDILFDGAYSVEEFKTQLGMTGIEGDVPVTYEDVSRIRMREKWFYNEELFTLDKKISRIEFLVKKIDPQTGEYLGDGALFYVKMN